MNQFNFFFDNFCLLGRKIAEIYRDVDKLSPPRSINGIENNLQENTNEYYILCQQNFFHLLDLFYSLLLTLSHDELALNLIQVRTFWSANLIRYGKKTLRYTLCSHVLSTTKSYISNYNQFYLM
ncbi:MAG: hypothetical protein AAFY21_00405 [Cyanobacteria bacterium J06641_2]